MNQDQVKEILLSVKDCNTEFSVIFSGKESKKVNGLYKPSSREIILHNKNFESDDLLLYTAFHEYAHHLHAEKYDGKISCRAHGSEFYSILHGLLSLAEEKQAYKNPFETIQELQLLAQELHTDYIEKNGTIMKSFGEKLIKAEQLCKKHNARFEDFLDRVVKIPRGMARTLIRISGLNIAPEIGFEAMKTVSKFHDPQKRNILEDSYRNGASQDEVKQKIKEFSQKNEDLETILIKEKARILRTIETLQHRLDEIDEKLIIPKNN